MFKRAIYNRAPAVTVCLDLLVEELPYEEKNLSRLIAKNARLDPDDVEVSYEKEGNVIQYVTAWQRVVPEIYCDPKVKWILDARECLEGKREFDLLGASEENIASLNLNRYDKEFQCVRTNQRWKFRLILKQNTI